MRWSTIFNAYVAVFASVETLRSVPAVGCAVTTASVDFDHTILEAVDKFESLLREAAAVKRTAVRRTQPMVKRTGCRGQSLPAAETVDRKIVADNDGDDDDDESTSGASLNEKSMPIVGAARDVVRMIKKLPKRPS